MVCQMELTCHLLTAAAFDCVSQGEITLAAQLIEKTPDDSLTLFDRGFYALGFFARLAILCTERHWLIPH